MTTGWTPSLGAVLHEDRCCFRVWAPRLSKLTLHLLSPRQEILPMEQRGEYFELLVAGIAPGQRYMFEVDGTLTPDPASYSQPEGVAGPSMVIDRRFDWSDEGWEGIALNDYIIYELHVGTFTREGTFDAIIPQLDRLVDLGVNAIEIMPIAQFSGARNWGYDGVFPFAAQNTYGGADGLKRLVDDCHRRGIAVILDVVYNHFGPEGNCVNCYGVYTHHAYRTSWGDAVNLDAAYSDQVRHYFIENTLRWLDEFHVDALRFDATHEMYDFSSVTFFDDLSNVVKDYRERAGRRIYMIAESDRNDPLTVQPCDVGGFGFDAQWNDDFHHAVQPLLIENDDQYVEDFSSLEDLVKALCEGFVYTGQHSVRRNRRHGRSSLEVPSHRFIIFTQNHDQIGNRMPAERFSTRMDFERLKVAAGILLLAPYVPLLFMGEEYGEPAPFNFFVDFSDPDLVRAVHEGRRRDFGLKLPAGVNFPDPQAHETFTASCLNPALRHEGWHRHLHDLYRTLIQLRKSTPALRHLSKERLEVVPFEAEHALFMRRWHEDSEIFAAFSFNDRPIHLTLPIPPGCWCKLLVSSDPAWRDGAPANLSAPDELYSTQGQLELTLEPTCLALYTRTE